jgi:predicted transglutaminase-like cysteine proteinase
MERRSILAHRSPKRASLAAAALVLAAVPSAAGAQMFSAGMIRLAGESGACTARFAALSPASGSLAAAGKSAAILGGTGSALDAIRQQQASAPSVRPNLGALIAEAATAPLRLSPGADAAQAVPGPCGGLIAARPAVRPGLASTGLAGLGPSLSGDPEQFLASKRIRIAHTAFDTDWRRVRNESLTRGQTRRYLGAVPAGRDDTLASVNRWVNRQITYVEDRDLFGKNDYWAGARKTLKLRKGDCEDMALLKMQMLAAAGIPREDMILTIARDLVRMADHAVLVVRSGNGYRLLDNASDEVLDAAPQHDYRAILSFGSRETWLHGA